MKTFRTTIILFSFLCICIQSVFAQGYDPRRSISVSGNAEVKVIPDEVIISMAIETNSITLDNARKENDEKVSGVLSMARKLGVEDKYIQTDFMHVEPRYDNRYDNGQPAERKFL